LDFRILGILEVCDGGRPVAIGAAKERALLAELVLHANQIVSRERLVEVVWRDNPPATAAATLNTYVSHLRSALEPGRAARTQSDLLLTRDPGYLLAVDPERVDALRFERLAGEGRRLLAAGDAVAAAATLREALGLWRGGALADFVYEPFAQAEAMRLEELRLSTLEQRIDADLALGRHHDLVAELRRVVDEHPLREHLWGQLMRALYGCGRQSEALRAFGELRTVLLEELGIDPSPALRRLEDDMLQQRRDLEVPAAPGSPADMAPVPARPVRLPSNLPVRLTSFVGREDDLAEIERLCAGARLVTLLGSGGVGKTRLAVEVASRVLNEHPDGVFLVELAPLSDAGGLCQQVLAALGVGEDDRHSPRETLAAHVASRRMLLVLDNCEHLVDACAVLVEELLSAGPGVRILATSRELLRVPLETAWRVPSMSTPPAGSGLEELAGFEAAHLFLERARSMSPGLELSDADAGNVARICARLEGIPLAIELAAARTRLLSLGEIAERLDDRFELLSSGARTAPRRHQTLRAAVDWSYDSLSTPERRLFEYLSVFSGGFTLPAAEAVCDTGELAPASVLETLGDLVDKSMVLCDPGPGRAASRFRLLETLRQYGAERLAERGATEAARGRHVAWAVALAAEAEPHLEGTGQAEWLQRLAVEHDNLRSALGWATSCADGAALLSLATLLGRFWEVRGHLSEGRRWFEAALEAESAESAALRARAHRWAGVLAQRQGDHLAARRHYEAGLALSRDARDRRGTASALHSLGNLEGLQGRLDAANALYEESLSIGRDLGDRRVAAASLTNLGWIAQTRGDFAGARRFSEEALSAWQELGDQQGLAQTLTAVAYLALLQGDYATVRSSCAQSLELQHALGDRYGACWSLTYVGWASQNEGDRGTARQLHDEALAARRELGDRYGEAWSLSHLGDIERAAGHPAEARRLLDQSLQVAEALGDTYCISWSLLRLAKLARSEGEDAVATDFFRRGLAVAGRHGDRVATAECLEGLAATLADAPDEREEAARLFGTAHALREAAGAPVPPAELSGYERDVNGVRSGLREAAFTRAWDAGRVAAVDDVVRRHAWPHP
jgi:predicted ATPase/DNA-binding SARP family transcriptional activator